MTPKRSVVRTKRQLACKSFQARSARYGWAYSAPAYALAAFTGYSRVESDHPYWRDVAAGAGIGILSSRPFTYHMKRWTSRPRPMAKRSA